MNRIKKMIMVVMSALLLFTAVPASAHIPHQENDNYEYHNCYPPTNTRVVLRSISPVVQVRTNVTGWHDVGFEGFAGGWTRNMFTETRTYLSAYNYKTITLPAKTVLLETNYGSSISVHGSAWLKFISSLEHNNVYVELLGFSCYWDYPTG